jgi:hypothetical protein
VVLLDRKDPEVEVVALEHKEALAPPEPQAHKVYREQLARAVLLVKPEQLVRMALKGLQEFREQS